jgi:hypothetical protein
MVDELETNQLELEELDQPQLLIRLNEDVGKLPKGLVYRLPTDVSNALIMRRKATPVGDMAVFPDLDISEAELEDAGLDWDVIQS